MGGRFGKNRAAEDDSFYNAVPPGGTFQSGYDPSGGLGAYDPYEEYGDPGLSMGNYYGGRAKRRPTAYGGRYAQGLNQMPGVAPWNYGNYYLGNTTMQMMPMMLNKVHQYGQIQAMSALGNAGLLGPRFGNTGLLGANFGNAGLLGGSFGSFGSFGNFGSLGGASMMPCCPAPSFSMPMAAPMMSCCPPSSFNFSSAAPMMAAATPLPVAFNPLVQGMYPMASMSPVNWMTPSSFMSALASGPMPYRPPGFDFPSNVGAVMTIPYGTPNPLLSAPGLGGYGSAANFGDRSAGNAFSFSMPATNPAPSNVSYYPRPVSIPQPYPVPYPSPVAVPNVQQVPVPRNVSVVAPPVVASNHPLPVSAAIPLWSSQGTFTDGPGGRPTVLASNNNSTTTAVSTNRPATASLPVYDTTDKSHFLIGQPVTSSLSTVGLNNTDRTGVTPSTAKNVKSSNRSRDTLSSRIRRHIPALPRLSRSNYSLNSFQTRKDPVLPPIVCGQLISDSGWLPKTSNLQSIPSILSGKRGTRSLYTSNTGKSSLYSSSSVTSLLKRNRRRRRHRSNSSASEYDCAICQQERDKRRLREHYGSSTLSSLLSSPTRSRRRHASPSHSASSSYKRDSYKSHRRHPKKIKIKNTTPSPRKSSSPVLLRTSSIPEQKFNTTIQEEKEESSDDDSDDRTPDKENKENQLEKKLSDDVDSIADKSDRYASKTSLKSIDD